MLRHRDHEEADTQQAESLPVVAAEGGHCGREAHSNTGEKDRSGHLVFPLVFVFTSTVIKTAPNTVKSFFKKIVE